MLMKKTIIGLSGLIVLTFFVIFALNAQNNNKEVRKSGTEVSQNIAQTVSPGSCCNISGSKTSACKSAKCSAMKCDASKCKAGRCDQGTCNCGTCDPANCSGKKCEKSAYKSNCSKSASGMLSGPMNCNRDAVIAEK